MRVSVVIQQGELIADWHSLPMLVERIPVRVAKSRPPLEDHSVGWGKQHMNHALESTCQP